MRFSDGHCCSVSSSTATVWLKAFIWCVYTTINIQYLADFEWESICLAKLTVMSVVWFKSRLLFAWRGQAPYQYIVSLRLSDSHSVMCFRACTNERLRVTLSRTSVTETSPLFFTITSCCINSACFNTHCGFTACACVPVCVGLCACVV